MHSLLSKMQLDYSIYRNLILKFLLAMLLFSISRIGFYLINQDYYPDMDLSKLLGLLKGGLVFDLTAVLYINAIFLIS